VLLVVGLGNPGPEYARTRHNVGFSALDRLAGDNGITLDQTRFSSRVGRGRILGADVLLVQPRTFMNLSGRAVRAVMDYLKIGLPDLLVLHDDMDIEPGRIKVAARGGSAGHKGVASIIETLGTDRFGRVKIGIGRPEPGRPAEPWVLGRFDPEEEPVIEKAIGEAAAAAEAFVSKGLAAAQEIFNRKDND